MSFDMTGRTVVVTGGSSGIGLAAARVFLTNGANVAICGRSADRLADATKALTAEFGEKRLYAQQCDVLDKGQIGDFAAAVAKRFGGVDTLVNNAGQARLSTFSSTGDDEWREELELKFFGVIHPTRAFLPSLEKSKTGAIVCVSSLLSLQPEPRLVATSAARAGQLNLLHSLAHEFAPKGIRVNTILIGVVDSGQWRRRFEALNDPGVTWEGYVAKLAAERGIPVGRLGTPEEAANAIFFLGTPMSSYTTGSTVDVSGGASRHVG